jgi:predicted O-methyltransferase YrrM
MLTRRLKPEIVVEFGAAFGVSGMHWLSGLRANAGGRLFTFEPNEVWAELARVNLERIHHPFELTVGTFEDNIAVLGDQLIDLAFIDAIHTSEFVLPQFDLARIHR